ncbi:MAG: ParB/RepB/Spo0J family partition protein [Alphaproteobacteria bacterium]|jgi:ParB family chromosome partitioning protein
MAKVRYKEVSPEMEKLAAPVAHWQGRQSIGSEDDIGEYYYIDVDRIVPYQNQARRRFDDEEIEQLSKTIIEYGVRQPLSILKGQDGFYQVVSGERRLRAARLAGLSKVPCLMVDKEKASEIALIENIQRADLHPVELGDAFSKLLSGQERGGVRELAARLGKSTSAISEYTRLSRLPDDIKEYLIDQNLRSKYTLRKLLYAKSIEEMNEILGLGQDKVAHRKKVTVMSFDEESFFIDRNKIEKLTLSQRKTLKDTLLNLIEYL